MRNFIDESIALFTMIGLGLLGVAGVVFLIALTLIITLGPFAIIGWAVIEAVKISKGIP